MSQIICKLNDIDNTKQLVHYLSQIYPNIIWDIHPHASIAAMKQIIAQFHLLAGDWPLVVNNTDFISVAGGDNWGTTEQARALESKHDKPRSALEFNLNFFKDLSVINRQLTNDEKCGWSPKGCNDIAYLTSHEFGHMVQTWIMSVPDVKYLFIDWCAESNRYSNVSGYAKKKKHGEAWAEGFSILYHSTPPWPAYIIQQRDFLIRICRQISIPCPFVP